MSDVTQCVSNFYGTEEIFLIQIEKKKLVVIFHFVFLFFKQLYKNAVNRKKSKYLSFLSFPFRINQIER